MTLLIIGFIMLAIICCILWYQISKKNKSITDLRSQLSTAVKNEHDASDSFKKESKELSKQLDKAIAERDQFKLEASTAKQALDEEQKKKDSIFKELTTLKETRKQCDGACHQKSYVAQVETEADFPISRAISKLMMTAVKTVTQNKLATIEEKDGKKIYSIKILK